MIIITAVLSFPPPPPPPPPQKKKKINKKRSILVEKGKICPGLQLLQVQSIYTKSFT